MNSKLGHKHARTAIAAHTVLYVASYRDDVRNAIAAHTVLYVASYRDDVRNAIAAHCTLALYRDDAVEKGSWCGALIMGGWGQKMWAV